jgi:cobalt-zinc-cadmium efflux system outer membrane protein
VTPDAPHGEVIPVAAIVAVDERKPRVLSLAHAEALPSTVLTQPVAPARMPVRMDLIQSLETSLIQNPDLTALRRNEGVSVAALGVARTYPFNPFVQAQATPFQDSKSGGPGTVYHYVLLMQQIQLGHQQRFREENALAALNSVRWNIVQAELLNVAQTERLYFTAVYLRGIRDLLQANVAVNDQLLTILEKRMEAGDAAGADVAIVRLDNRAARQQARLAEANYQTALLDLRRQLNFPIAVPLEPIGDLSEWEWLSPLPGESLPSAEQSDQPGNPMDAPSVAAGLVASRPDVLAARADLAAARANVNFARGARIPDLQIGPYYQRTESGTTYLGFRAQTDIPVLNNGVPLVRQRQAEVAQRHAVWQQLQIRAQLEAEAAIDRYERARQAIAESGEFSESLPKELQRLEQQFRAGEVDFLRIVTARTSLIQARRAHLDLLNEAAQAAAVVTAVSGLPPESILRLKSSP